jgi:heme/copper-type cytochrome/quinol oxidase subunit 2
MATALQMYFIEPASLQMEGIMYLHEHIFSLLCGISATVLVLYRRVLLRSFMIKNEAREMSGVDNLLFMASEQRVNNPQVSHDTQKFLEIFWTIVPACILLYIAGPSFALLYSMDEIAPETFFTVLVQGSQWYWSYEYYLPFLNEAKIAVSSYMVSDLDLEEGQVRLLTVNNPIYIPRDLPTRFLITATDVLHSWAIPSLGVKVDAVPGRLNQLLIQPTRSGIFFGQCSEICGANHGFMPITVYCVSPFDLIAVFEA